MAQPSSFRYNRVCICFVLNNTSQPPTGTDTVVRNGANHNTATKIQCISAMKQYENYSVEVSTFMTYVSNHLGAGVAVG